MAPRTRLQRQPTRRVQYAESSRPAPTGSRANPIEVEGTPEPVAPISSRTRRVVGKASGDNGVKKSKAAPKKSTKVVVPVKKKKVQPKRECAVCADTKIISTSFKLDGNEDACEHFRDICSRCVENIVKGKIENRHFHEAGLACIYPGCDHVLDMSTLKETLPSKAAFSRYDAALTKHFLSASPHYIACLNPSCGEYFSIEDCSHDTNDTVTPKKPTKSKGKAKTKPESDINMKKLIACPYCDYELCMTCNRPWHAKTDCSSAKAEEDAASLEQIKTLGAKPCPQCGVNIEKRGGCDHMTCYRCHHNFCWQCLVTYDGREHAEGCIHGRRNVAMDIGNWFPDNATVEQVNAAIEAARRRLDDPNLDVQQFQQDLDAAQVAMGIGPGGGQIAVPQGQGGIVVGQDFMQRLQDMVNAMPNLPGLFGGGGGGAGNGAGNGAA